MKTFLYLSSLVWSSVSLWDAVEAVLALLHPDGQLRIGLGVNLVLRQLLNSVEAVGRIGILGF